MDDRITRGRLVKVWIETRLVRPPEHTISGRFGCSIMFVAYSKWLNQWYWMQPNSVTEKIPEPQEVFLEEDYIAHNMLATPRGRRETPSRIRRGKRPEQLELGV